MTAALSVILRSGKFKGRVFPMPKLNRSLAVAALLSVCSLATTVHAQWQWSDSGAATITVSNFTFPIVSTPAAPPAGATLATSSNPLGAAGENIDYPLTGDALTGDTNLGNTNPGDRVNATDFAILAANFKNWNAGDFNFDGIPNGADFALLAANFNQGATSPADLAELEAFAAANGLSINVPEPATASLLAIGVLGLLRRHRRA
jgi:hypothetical protein